LNKQNSPKIEDNKPKKGKKDDYYTLLMPERATAIRAIIANKVIEVLREDPLIDEKTLILKVLARDPMIKGYYMKTNSIAYIRYVIWDLAKKKVILKAKILGDNKHVYFFLPEQLDSLKEKIVMSPKSPE
jgi:hypothetical protein